MFACNEVNEEARVLAHKLQIDDEAPKRLFVILRASELKICGVSVQCCFFVFWNAIVIIGPCA